MSGKKSDSRDLGFVLYHYVTFLQQDRIRHQANNEKNTFTVMGKML
jgi:hypothetical protein